MEEAGTVDALDARHFDVGGGAGPRDIGGERRRQRATVEVFGQCFDDLAGAQDAEMPIWQKGENATALTGGMMEHNRTRVRHTREGRSDDSIAGFDFRMGKASIELPIKSGGEPFGGQARRHDKSVLAARMKAIGHAGGKIVRCALYDISVVFLQPLNH